MFSLSLLPLSVPSILRRTAFSVSIDITMSVDVGTRLGTLEITALLRKGGMGEVVSGSTQTNADDFLAVERG
jgi:hypothetical protein